ncbi:unnamed protein product [Musa acuminata var. zebrina]
MDEGRRSVQLIDGDGVFNVAGIEHFMKTTKLVDCGLSYAVVSIMGPQSSGIAYEFLELLLSVLLVTFLNWTGKSTLLNHLFGTKFKEMDALMGRQVTNY